MKELSNEIKIQFYRFLSDEITLKQFEEWLYENDSLIKTLDNEDYISLLSMNFNERINTHDIKNVINKIITYEDYQKWWVKKNLNGIISNEIDIISALRNIAHEHRKGCKYITSDFVTYESELDDVPTKQQYYLWDRSALEEKLKKIDLYRDDIIKSSKDLLTKLSTLPPNGACR